MPVVVQFFKDMNPVKLATLGLGILTFLIIFVVYLSKISTKEMAVLYSDLNLEDSNKVIQELESKKIPYQLTSNGSAIKVPEDQVVKLRVNLAQSGLPSHGSLVGYEIFDKEDSIGTTNFSQNIKMVRALEGEISRTIAAIDQIEKARVHLVLPQREVFSKERIEPRASIVIKFKGNKSLNKAEIEAVGHLVVTAVPGLDMKNVTIVDTKGRSLKLGANEEDDNFGSGQNEEFRSAYENRIKKIIEDLLEQSVGVGKVKAQVTAEMNFDRTVTNSETYDPDGAVVRSTQSTDEKERTPVGGEDSLDVSVANNLPGLGGGVDQDKNFATIEKSDQTTNYEISKVVKNHISESGTIQRLSIGVLVDGSYKRNEETSKMDYSPRSKEELDKIENLVKVAVGFSDERSDKIEVVNLQFSKEFDWQGDENDTSWIIEELPNLFQTLVFAVVVLLVLITVIRPIALKAFDVKRGGDFAGANGVRIEGYDGTMVAGVELTDAQEARMAGEGKSSPDKVSQKINEMVVSSPQETVIVLRKWLNES